MIIELTCAQCGKDFETDFPYGGDCKCPHCGTWLTTEMEEGWDSLWAWVTGISETQEPSDKPPSPPYTLEDGADK